ncbi:sperm-associated antigen 7 homolog [Anopheles nili]|uniref:sperm-associated antigen 7 homolog n=1 Tax=Anopheles nili TaxID=185578 RepID=UPI00237B5FA4|nr:sperm-associated antigen 7 homolog [Anopheles nili]
MDLLGSILGSMDKPPTRDKKEKDTYENQKRAYQNIKNRQREELNSFRIYVEERLGRLIKDNARKFMEFQPLDQVHRSIVHDVAETAGLISMSFGLDVDRYIVVYKKEHSPCEDEMNARKNGDVWNKDTAKQYAEQRQLLKLKQSENQQERIFKKNIVEESPSFNYQQKYVHLFTNCQDAGKTEANRSYGYVPSDNKKDLRSIEQTMADIKAKKRQKLEHIDITEKN